MTVKDNEDAISRLRRDTEQAIQDLQAGPALPAGAPQTLGEALAYVYQRVGYVQKGRSKGLNYSFAGEAAMIAHVRPIMAAAGLVGPFPVDVELKIGEHGKTRSGAMQTRHDLIVTYHLLHAATGKTLAIKVPAEGIDAGDKGTAKAMTGAYKYVLRQLWCLETGDDPDRTPSRDQEVPADPPQAQNEPVQLTPDPHLEDHDPEWPDDRARFCAKLRDLGLSYEMVRAWGIDTGHGKPSTWGHGGRVSFMRALLDNQHPDLWQSEPGAG